ncbi:hypothetical protein MNBD_PLANCTO03-2133 [hydrothermal vent metagenome]|uniref:Uncharacterized protein n=1 Tax=hydrothermal vent metagenome TaxID=652676 RepID=A0A3B1DYT6_9ZZZZ
MLGSGGGWPSGGRDRWHGPPPDDGRENIGSGLDWQMERVRDIVATHGWHLLRTVVSPRYAACVFICSARVPSTTFENSSPPRRDEVSEGTSFKWDPSESGTGHWWSHSSMVPATACGAPMEQDLGPPSPGISPPAPASSDCSNPVGVTSLYPLAHSRSLQMGMLLTGQVPFMLRAEQRHGSVRVVRVAC